MDKQVDEIKAILNRLRTTINKNLLKEINFNKCERVIEKLDFFSASCGECQQFQLDLKSHFNRLEVNMERIGDTEMKQHKRLINNTVTHLQKKHKLVSEGYYLSIFMSIGLSLGLAFGLTIFDNFGLGLPIGLSMGIAIGAGMDADAKKKGKTI